MMPIRGEYGETVFQRVDLHRAAMKGDWESALNMAAYLTTKITDKHETALHIAAGFKHHKFVKALIDCLKERLSREALKIFLETQNCSGNTALSYAAVAEEVEIARLMVETYHDPDHEHSPGLPDLGTVKPVLAATTHKNKKMVEYLFINTRLEDLNRDDCYELFVGVIGMGLYDKALNMIEGEARLALAYPDYKTALHVLACTPSAFVLKDPPLCRKFINFCPRASETSTEASSVIRLVNKLIETAIRQPQNDICPNERPDVVIPQTLLLAAEEGNTVLLLHLLRSDPGLIWKVLPGGRSIFHIAIEKRHESIFTLIHEFGALKDLIAKNEVVGGNNMLHLAAKLAPKSKLNEVSGAALQMQRELLWFKEVEKVVEPSLIHTKNDVHETPQILFSKEHKDLRNGGEKWMKDTAKSGMLVATLIATVTFAAVLSVPGGFDNSSGKPLLQNRSCFWIFWLSNAVAWFSASTSIIMFLFILTSRYAEEDFLYSLPDKLTIGVGSLLVSVLSMMVAFCATFLLYYHFGWLIGVLAVFPLLPLGYVSVKYPLLFDVIFLAYRSRLMFRWPRRLL